MVNKLLYTVSLPYSTVRGSFAYRQYKAEHFTRSVMDELFPYFNKEKGISLSKLGRILKRILPKNLDVFVRKNKATDAIAQLDRVFTKDSIITKQSLDLTPEENGKINLVQFPEIAHEIRHLADSIFHPKFLLREQTLTQKGLDTYKYSNLYDQDVYVLEMFLGKKDKKRIIKDIKHKTLKVIRGLNIEDKIDLLQTIRYNLITEKNAYKEGQKYAKKLYKKYMPIYENNLFDETKELMLDEKIKLYNEILFDLIQKERGIHKAKIKKANKKSM